MNRQMFLKKLKNAQVFLGNFEKAEDVEKQFEVSKEVMNDVFILLAWYGYGDYDGSAFVLFERGGKLYEVNGGHCSCNGLEGQWTPEETTAEALVHRIKKGQLGRDSYYAECTFADILLRMLEDA